VNAVELIDKLVAAFDVDRTTALQYLNDVHRRAVVESFWRPSTVSLGNTVVDQGEYTLPTDVVNLKAVRIVDSEGNTTIYDPASLEEIWSYDGGTGSLDGAVFAENVSTAGVVQVSLRPAPDTAGLAITGLQALMPAALTDSSGAAGTPIIPDDFHLSLLYEGMVAAAYRNPDEAREDMAVTHEERMLGEIERLKARKTQRIGGGPSRMRVWGYDFAS
jgi:hypothetical protein